MIGHSKQLKSEMWQKEPFGRRLSPDEAKRLGYRNLAIRADDGTVQSMETGDGYRVTYGAPSYLSAALAAQGIEAGTAETGTGSVHESPVGAISADAPEPQSDTPS